MKVMKMSYPMGDADVLKKIKPCDRPMNFDRDVLPGINGWVPMVRRVEGAQAAA